MILELKYNDGLPEFDLMMDPLSASELDALRRLMAWKRRGTAFAIAAEKVLLVLVFAIVFSLWANVIAAEGSLRDVALVVWAAIAFSTLMFVGGVFFIVIQSALKSRIERCLDGLQYDTDVTDETLSMVSDADLIAGLYVTQVKDLGREFTRAEVALLMQHEPFNVPSRAIYI